MIFNIQGFPSYDFIGITIYSKSCIAPSTQIAKHRFFPLDSKPPGLVKSDQQVAVKPGGTIPEHMVKPQRLPSDAQPPRKPSRDEDDRPEGKQASHLHMLHSYIVWISSISCLNLKQIAIPYCYLVVKFYLADFIS